MGLVIESGEKDEEDRVEMWQSSYGTFSTIQQSVKEAIAAQEVDPQIKKMIEDELKRVELGLAKVPEFSGLVTWYKAHVPDIFSKKRPEMINEWWKLNYRQSKADTTIRAGGELFVDMTDGEWRSKECTQVLAFLRHFEPLATPIIEKHSGVGSYGQLVHGLEHCIRENVSAIFC